MHKNIFELKKDLFPVKHILTSGEISLCPMCNSLYVDWISKILLAKRISAMPLAVARLSASSMCTYVWHTVSINKKYIFDVWKRRDFFDVAAGLCTGGLQPRGPAEFMTANFVRNSTHCLDLLPQQTR